MKSGRPKRCLASVVIPAYNAETYLKEAVDSVLAQTYSPVEIIVVDDGSTDGTGKILADYVKEGSLRYIYQPNKGLAGARNTGLRNSKGEFVAFLDADDLFLPEKLERQIGYLKAHPECDVSYCDIWHFYEEEPDKVLKLDYRYYSGQEVFVNLLEKNFINPLSVVMRRSVAERCGYFNESLKKTEDWDHWVKLTSQGINFCFLPEILAKYRIRRSSTSHSWSSETQMKETALDIFERLKQRLSEAERQKYNIDRVIFWHKIKLLYAKLANHVGLLRSFHLWVQSRRLRPVGGNAVLDKFRLFLAKHPPLRIALRRVRLKVRKMPLLGQLLSAFERPLVFAYAEERYNPRSPFADGTDLEIRAAPVLKVARGRVLDLGCGYGYLTERIAEKEEVSGIVAIDKITNFRCFRPKIKYLTADITRLEKLPGKFDVIIATEFIEHVSESDLRRLLSLVKGALLPGGLFVGTTPDGELKSPWPFHVREYTHEELRTLLKGYFGKVEIADIGLGDMFFRAENWVYKRKRKAALPGNARP